MITRGLALGEGFGFVTFLLTLLIALLLLPSYPALKGLSKLLVRCDLPTTEFERDFLHLINTKGFTIKCVNRTLVVDLFIVLSKKSFPNSMSGKKRKGMSLDDKRTNLLKMYYERKEVLNLKEVEKYGAKKGIVLQSVKDVN